MSNHIKTNEQYPWTWSHAKRIIYDLANPCVQYAPEIISSTYNTFDNNFEIRNAFTNKMTKSYC